MQTTLSSIRLGASLICAGAAFALPALRAADTAAQTTGDAFPTFESYIKISGYAPAVSGDKAAFATRTDNPSVGSYGVEDLFFTKDISDGTTMKIQGRALSGTDDYLASLNLTKDSLGSIDAGYKRFRTFYDGIGGFFPQTDTFFSMNPEELHVDRGTAWVDFKFAKGDSLVVTLSFHDDVRTGQKDSTEWGPVINPAAVVTAGGTLIGTTLPVNFTYIYPNLLSLSERHQTYEASVTATFGKTTNTLKATVDRVNNLDTRYYTKYPGSTVVATATTLTGTATVTGSYRPVSVLDDQEAVKTNDLRVVDQIETKFTDHLALEIGLSFFHVASEDGGQWITPAYSTTANAVFPTGTALNIYTAGHITDYVGNAFLKYTPTKDWRVEVGYRQESSVLSDGGGFTTTSLATGSTSLASTNITTANDVTYSHQNDHVATPEASVTYTGIDRLTLYLTMDKRVDHGNQRWINPYAAITTTGLGVVTLANAPIRSDFFQSANQDYNNWKAGANWNASSLFTVRAEVFHKDHGNVFTGINNPGTIGTASYGGYYAQDNTITGGTFSLVVKPLPELSFNTRYQPQNGTMSVNGNTVTGGTGSPVISGKTRAQVFSEMIDWTPYRQFYVEGSINVVYDYISTTYPVVIPSTTTSIAAPFLNANNNYVTGTVLCGFALDKATDAQVQGLTQRANNYNPQVALGGIPYGASFELRSVTVGLKHKFSNRLMGDVKVGYLKSTNATTGGFANYHGPLGYIALDYAL